MAGNADMLLMAWCFYKHGILPPEYRKLSNTDKILMLSAIEYFTKEEQRAMKRK